MFAGVVHAPDGSGMKLAAMIVCHTDPATAERDLAPFRHGAVTRVAPEATAIPHREPGFNLLLPSDIAP